MSADLPVDEAEFGRWRAEADRAFGAAELQATEGPANWACFLFEQCTQLAVKALLHGVAAAPWGHDLEELGGRIGEVGFALPDDVADALARLGRHYIPTRYPDAHATGPAASHYRRSDADQASRDATMVMAFVDSAWAALRGP